MDGPALQQQVAHTLELEEVVHLDVAAICHEQHPSSSPGHRELSLSVSSHHLDEVCAICVRVSPACDQRHQVYVCLSHSGCGHAGRDMRRSQGYPLASGSLSLILLLMG